jgi:hypothetical protein
MNGITRGACHSIPLCSAIRVLYNVFRKITERMKRSNFLLWLGISVAAGAVLGMFADRKDPLKGGLIGTAAGIVAGSAAAASYQYVTARGKIPYYSKSSPFYDEFDTI